MQSKRYRKKTGPKNLSRFTYLSPVGPLLLIFAGAKIQQIKLGSQAGSTRSDKRSRKVFKFLKEYFAGRKIRTRPIVDFTGRSQFEIKVLKAVQKIPYGKTRSYGYLAKSIGQAGAGRAVGQALARNAWPVLIPCHRVIRRDGSLGGFSGGLKWKKQLIMLEKK